MAYKVFQNGYPLPASELNNYLMNQTVMVFATASARAADIPSPTEGMVTYREDANVLEVYDGSSWTDINDNTGAIPKSLIDAAGDLIVGTAADTAGRLAVGGAGSILTSNGTTPSWLTSGTAGQYLSTNGTTPIWTTAATGSMTLISSASLTGASVSFSSIPGTYQQLKLVVKGARPATDGSVLYLRFNSASTIVNNTSAAWSSTESSASSFQNRLEISNNDHANDVNTGYQEVTISNYADTSYHKTVSAMFVTPVASGSPQAYFFGTRKAGLITTSAITELSLLWSSGNHAAGTAYLYGVN